MMNIRKPTAHLFKSAVICFITLAVTFSVCISTGIIGVSAQADSSENAVVHTGVYYPLNSSLSNAGSSSNTLTSVHYSSNFSSTSYNYYDQLDDNQQTVYDALKGIKPNSGDIDITLHDPISQSNAQTGLTNMIQVALDALLKDCPEIFWLKFGNDGCYFRWNEYAPVVAQVTFIPAIDDSYGNSAVTASSCYVNMINAVNSYTNAVTGDTRYEKLVSIHNLIARNITYNSGASHPYDAYGALVENQAVCEGYSESFKLICDKLNIPCVLACGTGVIFSSPGHVSSSGPHMWK